MTKEIFKEHKSVYYEKLPTHVHVTAHEASKAVANEIADLIRAKQQKGEYAVLGLATGSTPKRVYAELVRMHKEEGLHFQNVVTFNLDEYYGLPSESLQSYHHFMQENLFRHVNIAHEFCFIPDSDMPQALVKTHCEQYEKKIEEYGGIDFQLLGIGRNGHIGFNEPGSHSSSVTRLITLDPMTRSDAAVEFGGLAAVPRKAITMGVSTILKAKRVVLLAWGEHKAGIVKQAVEGPVTEFVPASYLQGHNNACFVIDETAASELTRKKTPWLTDTVVWHQQMIKKAVTHLALTVGKPVLKLTNNDYNENGLSDLLVLYGQAYDINIEVFNWLQHTITGWPGGKPNADDDNRPERAEPAKKRVVIFSPHPDDDIISMGGTFQRLVDQGHEVHVAYQTSGNIAVADDEAFRFIEFVKDYNEKFVISSPRAVAMFDEAEAFLKTKKNGEKDIPSLRYVKGLIRRGEAKNTCRFVGIPMERVHFLDLPFYETGTVDKNPFGTEDVVLIAALIEAVQPHQIYAAGDLADPHGTHKVCLDGIIAALNGLKEKPFIKDCWIWLYKGAWAEWDIDLIEMAVPMSPDQVLKKRAGIFKHQSQKDGVVFQGSDNREFWQRAEDRNKATADLYNKLGLAEYEAMEAFVRWQQF
ncbi:glucosamine-6-phosphate deaminase [Flavisolibacter ginsenosidimutans]|uniref:Glucosamine-6-phosphate deaminase n=1 Tax=Flavisolibacter ginsenosidimutans TaxID=661481 RepID=A0A5B8UID3_9BACT|nr:glucosamine-6-phosphate deaminase [Flavisolibacter ginsenosidimutans]QEC56308.1 glucosamine-6-phosphate deaminase [Flavisolibacter ginsenosidimutans]